jgi:hypothetical protein
MYTNRRFIALGAAGSTILLAIVLIFILLFGLVTLIGNKKRS